MEKQNEEEGYALLQTATYFTYLSTEVIAVCMVVRSKSIGDVFVKISIVKISVEKVVAARSVLLAWRIIKIIEQEIFYLLQYNTIRHLWMGHDDVLMMMSVAYVCPHTSLTCCPLSYVLLSLFTHPHSGTLHGSAVPLAGITGSIPVRTHARAMPKIAVKVSRVSRSYCRVRNRERWICDAICH